MLVQRQKSAAGLALAVLFVVAHYAAASDLDDSLASLSWDDVSSNTDVVAHQRAVLQVSQATGTYPVACAPVPGGGGNTFSATVLVPVNTAVNTECISGQFSSYVSNVNVKYTASNGVIFISGTFVPSRPNRAVVKAILSSPYLITSCVAPGTPVQCPSSTVSPGQPRKSPKKSPKKSPRKSPKKSPRKSPRKSPKKSPKPRYPVRPTYPKKSPKKSPCPPKSAPITIKIKKTVVIKKTKGMHGPKHGYTKPKSWHVTKKGTKKPKKKTGYVKPTYNPVVDPAWQKAYNNKKPVKPTKPAKPVTIDPAWTKAYEKPKKPVKPAKKPPTVDPEWTKAYSG